MATVSKTVQGKILSLTNRKQEILQKEYEEFNRIAEFIAQAHGNKVGDMFANYDFLKGKTDMHKQTLQCAIKYCTKVVNEQPLILQNQSVKVDFSNSKLTSL